MSKRAVYVVQCREMEEGRWRTICTSFEAGCRSFLKAMRARHPGRAFRMVKEMEAYGNA